MDGGGERFDTYIAIMRKSVALLLILGTDNTPVVDSFAALWSHALERE